MGQFQRWMQTIQNPQASQDTKGNAMYHIARAYELGQGVEQDVLQAVAWYEKALALPIKTSKQIKTYKVVKGKKVSSIQTLNTMPLWYGQAALHLATLYIQGKGVVTPRLKESFALLETASKVRLPEAWFLQGLAYMEGQGVNENQEKGFQWIRKAAEAGYPDATYKLAMCYAEGLGTTPNFQQAYVWSMLATALGVEPAQDMAEMLASHLTQTEVTQAQTWIRSWVERLHLFQ